LILSIIKKTAHTRSEPSSESCTASIYQQFPRMKQILITIYQFSKTLDFKELITLNAIHMP